MRPYEKPEIAQKLNYIKDCVLKVVPDTECIMLFGSYAYGEPCRDSDLDVYVVVPDTVEERDLDIEIGIRHEISKDYDKLFFPMDLLVSKSSIFFDKTKRSAIARTVAKEGVIIYGQNRSLMV